MLDQLGNQNVGFLMTRLSYIDCTINLLPKSEISSLWPSLVVVQPGFCWTCIHVISPYFGGSSLYFAFFLENLPTKIFRISYIFYISPYFEFQISLPKIKNSLLCLIILPIWKKKSPYLSSGMYHMSVDMVGNPKDSFSHDAVHLIVFEIMTFVKWLHKIIFIPPRKLCLWEGILFSHCPSVRTNKQKCVRDVLFP